MENDNKRAITNIKRQKVRAVLSSSLSSRTVLWKLEAYASGTLSDRRGHSREVKKKNEREEEEESERIKHSGYREVPVNNA